MTGAQQSHRILPALASLVLFGCALAAALTILPLRGLTHPDAVYVSLGSFNGSPGDGLVFTLGDDLFPHQCGRALLTPAGTLNLFAYADPECRERVMALRPYLLAADLRVPWAIVPRMERDDLGDLAGTVMAQWESVCQELFHSAFFVQTYAPTFKDILRTAFRQAWTAPATEQSLVRASETFDRRQLDQMMEGLVPIIVEKAKKNFWQTVHSYTEAFLGSGDKVNQEAVMQLGTEVFSDPRARALLTQTLPTVVTSREVITVGAVLARETSKAVMDDPRTLPLIGRLLTDQRFLNLQPFSADAEHLLRVLPVRLMRLRHRLDHNPLATYVLHTMIRGQHGFLVLLLSPQQERQLANSDLPPGPSLRRVTP